MIISVVEKMAHDIGYDIAACSSDRTQADLLNGFSEGICNSIRDKNNKETQLCYIADKLSKKSEFVIKALHEFIILKDKEE